jgi:putative ABC transport system ATP-binding protein
VIAAGKPIVQLRDVRKTYVMGHAPTRGGPKETVTVHALKGVSVTFMQGEYVAIMGASGSGKSTMLNLLGCLDRPSSGQYILGDQDVARLDDDELSEVRSRYIGFIFQSYNLIQQYTVVENIQLPLTYQGSGEISDEDMERTLELAKLVGLDSRLDHRPNQLSGGQQQRVAVARAVAGDPAILLADEPTGNLDSVNGESVMELLRDLHRNGATICMVTHDQRYAQHADRSVHLFDGRVVEEQAAVHA